MLNIFALHMASLKTLKHYGQHWLTDKNFADRIVSALDDKNTYDAVLEIGPGTGILTSRLLDKYPNSLCLAEIDKRAIEFLKDEFELSEEIFLGDFLANGFNWPAGQTAVIGNFPYNISSQIVFAVLQRIEHVPICVGMFQKEMAQRIASVHGNKTYGILSVLAQAFYDTKILFKIKPGAFHPPPKVDSAVITFVRKEKQPNCKYSRLREITKAAFSQRRKKITNTLKAFPEVLEKMNEEELHFRAEQFSVERFVELASD